MLVVVVAAFVISVVSHKLVIVRVLSADHCRNNWIKLILIFVVPNLLKY